MADHHILLSTIARDPVVAAFLARGERDTGTEPAIGRRPRPRKSGGAAEVPTLDRETDAFDVLNDHFGRGENFLNRVLEDA